MKTLFEKKSKRLLSLVLATLLLLNIPAIEVMAADNAPGNESRVELLQIVDSPRILNELVATNNTRAMLYNCTINVYSSSNGLQATFVTDCSQEASTIGVKDIVIKQKVWYGWKTVATSSGGYGTDSTAYMGSVLYTNAIKGETYRISCVHYADADVYTELDNQVDVIFTY